MNYRTARSAAAAAGDALLWLLIVTVGAVALSPFSGLAAARETIAARRRLRAIGRDAVRPLGAPGAA